MVERIVHFEPFRNPRLGKRGPEIRLNQIVESAALDRNARDLDPLDIHASLAVSRFDSQNRLDGVRARKQIARYPPGCFTSCALAKPRKIDLYRSDNAAIAQFDPWVGNSGLRIIFRLLTQPPVDLGGGEQNDRARTVLASLDPFDLPESRAPRRRYGEQRGGEYRAHSGSANSTEPGSANSTKPHGSKDLHTLTDAPAGGTGA